VPAEDLREVRVRRRELHEHLRELGDGEAVAAQLHRHAETREARVEEQAQRRHGQLVIPLAVDGPLRDAVEERTQAGEDGVEVRGHRVPHV
jgi:hypothetical protein